MTSSSEIVAVARSWCGVKLMHRQASRFGIDCINLIIEVGVESGAMDRPSREYSPLYAYGRLPNAGQLIRGLNDHMLPLGQDEWGPGDVVALSWGKRDEPMHVAVLAAAPDDGRPTIIHAYPLAAPKVVREMTYGADWPDRACSYWRYPRRAA